MIIDNTRLVVVGGAGLIGSHTVDELLKGPVPEIVVFDNFARGRYENLAGALEDQRVTVVEGDISHPGALLEVLEGADGVFHFAALWLLQCQEHPREGFDMNVTGTFNVLDACRAAGVKRLVFSLSPSVCGDSLREPIDESHPFNNTTFYGVSKIVGEVMVHAFFHRDGLEYVGLRHFNVHGPRRDYKGAYVAAIMRILDSLDIGEAPKVHGDGKQAFDFVSVRDCARANVATMNADAVGRCHNVCTGRKTSIGELAEVLIGLTGQQVGVDYLPVEASLVRNRIGDPMAAIEDLSCPADTDLIQGLRKLVSWHTDHMRALQVN